MAACSLLKSLICSGSKSACIGLPCRDAFRRLTSPPRICVNHPSPFLRRDAACRVSRPEVLMREVIATDQAPKAIGPYSQAIKAAGLIFTSGQVAIDPATQQVIAGDVAAQTDRVLKNLSAVLQASGSSLGKA